MEELHSLNWQFDVEQRPTFVELFESQLQKEKKKLYEIAFKLSQVEHSYITIGTKARALEVKPTCF